MNQILEEKVYALALYEAEGLGSMGLRKLLAEYGSPAEIMEQKEEEHFCQTSEKPRRLLVGVFQCI